jgi:tripartite-type tricarboxylate transporter receptor subunit TctC
VQVSADSPYRSAKELLDAIKAAPKGQFKASGTGQGGIWHVALGGWLLGAGLPADQVQWVPSQGAAPGLQDLAAGGVDIVTCSVPEAKALIDAGKVKSLAIMAPERNPLFPEVPTLKEATGVDFTIGAWRGIAGPKGMPQEAVDKLVPLLEKISASEEFKSFMDQRGFGTIYAGPSEFAKFMAERDAAFGPIMTSLGLAK